MKTIQDPKQMAAHALGHQKKGEQIVLVPTMGYLHDGHLSLVKKAKETGGVVCVSIFVNPTQFSPNEDLDRYPNDLSGDLEKLEKIGVDYVFTPEKQSIYRNDFNTYIYPKSLGDSLCGASRPDHFQGVCTVVFILLQITRCNIAIFGKKDFQQLRIIAQMVQDLWLDVKIEAVPTFREKDGLAMSSRNSYLNSQQRSLAPLLYQTLQSIKKLSMHGERSVEKLLEHGLHTLEQENDITIDYLQIVDSNSLKPIEFIEHTSSTTSDSLDRASTPRRKQTGAVCAIAAFVGKTRLIDNIEL